MELEIRVATPADADGLAPLATASARATYAPIAQKAVYETFIAQSCTGEALKAAISLATEDDDSVFAVAADGSSLVGYLDFGRDDDGSLELRRLYTAPGLTSRGIGSSLLRWLEDQLPARTEYRAIVHAGNRRALSFWTRHGFEVAGEVDTREHLAAHRGLTFDKPADSEPSLILRRITGDDSLALAQRV